MIKYINELILTEKTEKKIEKIKKDIEDGKWFSRICLVIMSENENDVFDIIQLYNLRTAASRYKDIVVLGIAENINAAIALSSGLIDEYINSEADKMYDSMRAYITDKYL